MSFKTVLVINKYGKSCTLALLHILRTGSIAILQNHFFEKTILFSAVLGKKMNKDVFKGVFFITNTRRTSILTSDVDSKQGLLSLLFKRSSCSRQPGK